MRPGNSRRSFQKSFAQASEPCANYLNLYFRGDAAFANPEVYEFLEAEGMGYGDAIPLNRRKRRQVKLGLGPMLQPQAKSPQARCEQFWPLMAARTPRSRHVACATEDVLIAVNPPLSST